MSECENIQTLKPLNRQNKRIIFKGKEYPINFELFQCHSNYFYEFSKDFENDHDILIFEDFSDISEETFSQFILSCQSERFSITFSNIIELHHLSIEYDVPHLKNLTNDIIEEHRDELIFKIIKYKYSKIRNKENTEKDVKYSLDLKNEEEIIAIHFFEYIKQEEFYELPIEFIYRVMNSERMKKEMNEEEDELEEFLMKSLKIYGREASILFTKVNFNSTAKCIKFIQLIIQEYSELIDFHMINPVFIMKTSLDIFDKYSELSTEHEKIKEENKRLLKKLEDQTKELSEYAIKEKKQSEKLSEYAIKEKEQSEKLSEYAIKEKEQSEKLSEYAIKEKEQSDEKIKLERNNKEQSKEIELLKNENNQLKIFFNEVKTKEYLFQQLVMASNINEFNELPIKFQSVIIKEMKNLSDIEIDTHEVIEKIERLLLYLSMNGLKEESGIHLMNETSNQIKDIKSISRVTILSSCTEILFNHKKLNTSEMKEIIKELPFVNIEMKYPSSSFESIYREVKDMKGAYGDKMCMTIFISNIDKTDSHFRNDKKITSIRLGDTIHAIIGDFFGGSFSGCSSLTQITIPSSVTSIGDNAFRGCSSLTQITIPSSVTSIGDNAFDGCSLLAQITIPSSVTSIGDFAFDDCPKLNKIIIVPNNKKIIDYLENEFLVCKTKVECETYESLVWVKQNIDTMTIPSFIKNICTGAFKGCSSLTQIIIPSSVTSIRSYTFSRCSSLTQITIPSSITSIGPYAFFGCSSLTQIIIPSSVTSIGSSAFRECSSLTQITIPSSVTSIGREAFFECSSLTQIIIPSSVTSIESSAFFECSSLTQITIPSSVTSIESSTFDRCSSLTQIIIPSSVTSIGDNAFSGCSSLIQIIIPSSLSHKKNSLGILSKTEVTTF